MKIKVYRLILTFVIILLILITLKSGLAYPQDVCASFRIISDRDLWKISNTVSIYIRYDNNLKDLNNITLNILQGETLILSISRDKMSSFDDNTLVYDFTIPKTFKVGNYDLQAVAYNNNAKLVNYYSVNIQRRYNTIFQWFIDTFNSAKRLLFGD